jgi:anti-anti-sigma regulatory factor
MAAKTGNVVLDATQCTLIDAQGLALCVGLLRELQRSNRTLVVETNPELAAQLRQLKFGALTEIRESAS